MGGREGEGASKDGVVWGCVEILQIQGMGGVGRG